MVHAHPDVVPTLGWWTRRLKCTSSKSSAHPSHKARLPSDLAPQATGLTRGFKVKSFIFKEEKNCGGELGCRISLEIPQTDKQHCLTSGPITAQGGLTPRPRERALHHLRGKQTSADSPGAPEAANENTGHPVTFEFQTMNHFFKCICFQGCYNKVPLTGDFIYSPVVLDATSEIDVCQNSAFSGGSKGESAPRPPRSSWGSQPSRVLLSL